MMATNTVSRSGGLRLGFRTLGILDKKHSLTLRSHGLPEVNVDAVATRSDRT
jgi:hypothetical protein